MNIIKKFENKIKASLFFLSLLAICISECKGLDGRGNGIFAGAYHGKGIALYELGSFQEAIQAYNEAIGTVANQ